MNKLFRIIYRYWFWLSVRLHGLLHVPFSVRRALRIENANFDKWIRKQYRGKPWKAVILRGALVQPFQDLLNRPAGGEAYCGGVVFEDPEIEPTLHHFRHQRSIDTPLTSLVPNQPPPVRIISRQFWCGPLAFHFGHQIADFGSRVLLASVDIRDGELLWFPWRSSCLWDELLPWQQFLLKYLNPGGKQHLISTVPVCVKELVVIPQQARMHASPTVAHLEALGWCENTLNRQHSRTVYVSRSRYAACTTADNLLGSFAAESLFETMLIERDVKIIYPESLSLKEQLQIYLGAENLIFSEGSAQHGLELLGFDKTKNVIVICRRPQLVGMNLPLYARFPNVQFLQALKARWLQEGGESWDGLAVLDWTEIVTQLNPFLKHPITDFDCTLLDKASQYQLKQLSCHLRLTQISPKAR